MGVGRPLQYEPDAMLLAVMQTFWQQGYDGTSMRDLLEATGLSKSSFYEAFSNKRDALERALARYCDMVTVDLEGRLRIAPSALGFIEEVLTEAAAEVITTRAPRGCMIVNVATEFGARDARIQALVTTAVGRVTNVFIAAVKHAQSDNEIGSDKDPKVLGRYLLASLSGLRTLVKAGSSHRALRDVVAVIMSALR